MFGYHQFHKYGDNPSLLLLGSREISPRIVMHKSVPMHNQYNRMVFYKYVLEIAILFLQMQLGCLHMCAMEDIFSPSLSIVPVFHLVELQDCHKPNVGIHPPRKHTVGIV